MIKVFDKLISISNDHEIIDVTRDCLVRHVSSASDKVLYMLNIFPDYCFEGFTTSCQRIC